MSSPTRTRRRRQLRKLAACPDCASQVRVIRDGPRGMTWLSVGHDDTCPQYRSNGAQPYREFRVIGEVGR